MRSAHILIAEDDAHIRAGLVDVLESQGYRVTPAGDGDQASERLRNDAFDLAILDIMMPGRSGFDLCREIRAAGARTGIIMLTAKGEEIDKVVGLELGADDYVTKPFGVRELLARVDALLRRLSPSAVNAAAPDGGDPLPAVFRFGDAEVDTLQFRLRRGRKTFDLTAREVGLLKLFKAHPDEVLSRDRLLNVLWGITYYGTTRTLDQHIAKLRKKIEVQRGGLRPIQTVHGVGYRYTPP